MRSGGWLLVVLIHGHAVWTGDAAVAAQWSLPQSNVDLVPAALGAAALTALLFAAWLRVGLAAAGLRRASSVRLGLVFAIENLADRFYREQFQFAPARGRSLTVGLHVRSR